MVGTALSAGLARSLISPFGLHGDGQMSFEEVYRGGKREERKEQ